MWVWEKSFAGLHGTNRDPDDFIPQGARAALACATFHQGGQMLAVLLLPRSISARLATRSTVGRTRTAAVQPDRLSDITFAPQVARQPSRNDHRVDDPSQWSVGGRPIAVRVGCGLRTGFEWASQRPGSMASRTREPVSSRTIRFCHAVEEQSQVPKRKVVEAPRAP